MPNRVRIPRLPSEVEFTCYLAAETLGVRPKAPALQAWWVRKVAKQQQARRQLTTWSRDPSLSETDQAAIHAYNHGEFKRKKHKPKGETSKGREARWHKELMVFASEYLKPYVYDHRYQAEKAVKDYLKSDEYTRNFTITDPAAYAASIDKMRLQGAMRRQVKGRTAPKVRP